MRLFYSLFILCPFVFSCNSNITQDNSTTADTTSAQEKTLLWTVVKNDSLPTLQEAAFDSIANFMDIRFRRISGLDSNKLDIENNNAPYFKHLDSLHGKNWKTIFDSKVHQLQKDYERAWDSKACSAETNEEEHLFVTTCTLANTSLQTAYSLYRIQNHQTDEGKFLLPILVTKDTIVKGGEYPLEIAYKKGDKNKLHVELLFPGGVTEVEFKYSPISNSTEIKTTLSPD